MIVLRAAPNEIDRLSARSAILDVLAAVVKPALVLFRPQIIDFGDKILPELAGLGFRDVYKEGLVGRASKGAEYVEKVVLASRARGDDSIGEFEVTRERIDLVVPNN